MMAQFTPMLFPKLKPLTHSEVLCNHKELCRLCYRFLCVVSDILKRVAIFSPSQHQHLRYWPKHNKNVTLSSKK